jgi:hypothetical protein
MSAQVLVHEGKSGEWDGEPGAAKSAGRVPLQRSHTMPLSCRGTHLPKTAKTAKTARKAATNEKPQTKDRMNRDRRDWLAEPTKHVPLPLITSSRWR